MRDFPSIFTFLPETDDHLPMHRQDDDVFEPTFALSTATAPSAPELLAPELHASELLAAPGPDGRWTARGVIDVLEPLSTPERCSRLLETLGRRISSVTVVFDHPHDPHNGSAVLRSCDAFGVQQVHVVSGSETFTASKMVSKGSERWVDIIHHESPHVAARMLHERGFRLLVTHPEGNLVPSDLPGISRVALILGNERDGVSQELTRLADDTVRIPMRGFVESLNVSVTAAILLQAACAHKTGDLSAKERENIYARWLRKSVPRADEVLTASDPC